MIIIYHTGNNNKKTDNKKFKILAKIFIIVDCAIEKKEFNIINQY